MGKHCFKLTLLVFALLLRMSAFSLSKDSLVHKINNFYFNIYSGFGYPRTLISDAGKYAGLDEYKYKYENKIPELKTPALGIGYWSHRKVISFQSDFNYFYCSKNINGSYPNNGNARTIYGPMFVYEIENKGIYYSNSSYVGVQYYKFDDVVSGHINIHYIDWNLNLGINCTKNWALTAGFRINHLLSYNYKATVTRQASRYYIKGITPNFSPIDSLLETKTFEINGEKLKTLTSQSMSGNQYLSLGSSFNFSLFNKIFLININYDICVPRRENYKRIDYLLFKVAYVLYSGD